MNRNRFSQICRDVEEFTAIPITYVTFGLISGCALVKGIVLTVSAISALKLVAGSAIVIFSKRLLLSSYVHAVCFTVKTHEHRLIFQRVGFWQTFHLFLICAICIFKHAFRNFPYKSARQ